MVRCLSARLGSKRAVQAKLGMYLLTSSLAAALLGEMRVLARWGGRVRTVAFLSILSATPIQSVPSERLRVLKYENNFSTGC